MAELNQIIGTFPNRTIVMEEDRESHCQSHKSRHHSHIQQKQISPVSKGSTLNTAPNSIQLCSFFYNFISFVLYYLCNLNGFIPKKTTEFPILEIVAQKFPNMVLCFLFRVFFTF